MDVDDEGNELDNDVSSRELEGHFHLLFGEIIHVGVEISRNE